MEQLPEQCVFMPGMLLSMAVLSTITSSDLKETFPPRNAAELKRTGTSNTIATLGVL